MTPEEIDEKARGWKDVFELDRVSSAGRRRGRQAHGGVPCNLILFVIIFFCYYHILYIYIH